MMRMLVTSLIATAALGVLESPQTVHAQNAAPTAVSAEQAREENAYAVGLQAYLWGFPLHYYSRSTPKRNGLRCWRLRAWSDGTQRLSLEHFRLRRTHTL